MSGSMSYCQRDFKEGQKWQITRPSKLSGMQAIPGGQQGWGRDVPAGTILTCSGVRWTFGDGVPVVKWLDADGNHIASDCTLLPAEGGMWSSVPRADHILPTSPEIEELLTVNCAIGLRDRMKAEIEQVMAEDAPALLARIDAHDGRWVIFDPESDADGFVLVGNDPWEMAREAFDHFNLEIAG